MFDIQFPEYDFRTLSKKAFLTLLPVTFQTDAYPSEPRCLLVFEPITIHSGKERFQTVKC